MIRGLYFTKAVCQETETTDGERSSEKKKLVITFLLATVGFLIGYVHSMAFYAVVTFQTNANVDINLYSDLKNGFQFLFGYSLCLNPLVYAFRSAHFKEGFRRVLTTCWKPTPHAGWQRSVFQILFSFDVPTWSRRKAEVRELCSNTNNRIWQCWIKCKWSWCRFFCLLLLLFVHNHSGRILAVWRKPEKKLSDHRKPWVLLLSLLDREIITLKKSLLCT